MRSLTVLLGGVLAMTTIHAAEDRMSYLDNGHIKLGINVDLGGAITWVSKSGTDVNLINSCDWGRQIQMSHYSGPVPFEPRGKKPTPTWAGLGWNPIQSGDCYGHRSKVLETSNDGHELYVECVPMQWPLENEPGECTFTCRITLDGDTAHVRAQMVNQRSDKTQFDGRGQELPAIYTNGPWWRLMTYTGDKPFTGGELTQAPAKFPWTGWDATENWTALVDDEGFGLGIYEPGLQQFIGGFAGQPGHGGPKDNPTGYIAPLYDEVLDWNITYSYDYTLIPGKLEAIRKWVYDHAPQAKPPTWVFSHDRSHWFYRNAHDEGWPIERELKVLVDRQDPQMFSPRMTCAASAAPTLYIAAAYDGPPGEIEVFWSTRGKPGFAAERRATTQLINDGGWRVYEVHLSESPEYGGQITQLRVDPGPGGGTGHFRCRQIGFEPPLVEP